MKLALVTQECLIGIYFLAFSVFFLTVQVNATIQLSKHYVSMGFYQANSATEVRIYIHELLNGLGNLGICVGSIGLLLRKRWGWQLLVGAGIYMCFNSGFHFVKTLFLAMKPFQIFHLFITLLLFIHLLLLFRLIQSDFQERYALSKRHLLGTVFVLVFIYLFPLGIEWIV
ncbi:MAG: hypothetical protein RL607_2311 [Bacteroidota bacterium]|jgi:hypothetical protein